MNVCDHETEGKLQAYVAGTLSPESRAPIEEHLASCRDCRLRLEQLRNILPALSESEDHVPVEMLVALAHNAELSAADEDSAWTEALIAHHIQTCEECRSELNLIRTIETDMARADHEGHEFIAAETADTVRAPRGARIIHPTAVVLLAAAAVLLIYVMGRIRAPQPTSLEWLQVEQIVATTDLVPMTSRSQLPSNGFATERDAAVAAFADFLSFDNGQFSLPDTRSDSSATHERQQQMVAFIGPAGNPVAIAASFDRKITASTAWLLELPSRTLFRVPARGDSISVAWPTRGSPQGCVTWTYPTANGYGSMQPVTIRPY